MHKYMKEDEDIRGDSREYRLDGANTFTLMKYKLLRGALNGAIMIITM